jgi:WD40 repeat protein
VNGTASLFNTEISGELRRTRSFTASLNEFFVLSPNGRWLARLLPEGDVRLRSLSGSANDEIPLALPWLIRKLSFSTDGRRLAGLLVDGRAVLWDTGARESWLPFFSTRYNGGQSSGVLQQKKSVGISTGLRATSNQARRIGGVISLWSTSTFSAEQTLSEPGGDWFYGLHLAPDESYVFALGSDGHVWRFDLASGATTKLITGDPIYATAIALSSDGAELFIGTIDGSVISVDAVDGHRKTTFPGSFDGAINALAVDGVSGSGTIAAAGGRGSDILVWRSSRESRKKVAGGVAG